MNVCLPWMAAVEMMDDESGVMNGESSGTKLKVYSSVLPSQLMINWACHVQQYMSRFKHGRLFHTGQAPRQVDGGGRPASDQFQSFSTLTACLQTAIFISTDEDTTLLHHVCCMSFKKTVLHHAVIFSIILGHWVCFWLIFKSLRTFQRFCMSLWSFRFSASPFLCFWSLLGLFDSVWVI